MRFLLHKFNLLPHFRARFMGLRPRVWRQLVFDRSDHESDD